MKAMCARGRLGMILAEMMKPGPGSTQSPLGLMFAAILASVVVCDNVDKDL